MAILAECPICRARQSVKNKVCKCGTDLDRAKRSKKVKYWVNYRLPGGKQKRELVGYSIKEAQDAEGKRRSQKREGRLFDVKPEVKMTFQELAKWYLNLEKVKALASYWVIELSLKKFNTVFGKQFVSKIKSVDLENYQAKRKKEGIAPATIDHEIGKTKTMIRKAFDNDLVGGDTLRTFNRVKKTLKKGSDVRDRILTRDEFNRLIENAALYLKPVLAMGYFTGMRRGEILNLTLDRLDLKNRVIHLEEEDTKDHEARTIPLCDELHKILSQEIRIIRGAGEDNHVFLYRGKPIVGVRAGVKRACKKAEIIYGRFEKGGFIFHDLRHTFNTNMRKAGVVESVIMEITGHSTREMFDRYNTIDEEDVRKAVDQLEVFFGNVDQTVDQDKKKTQAA